MSHVRVALSVCCLTVIALICQLRVIEGAKSTRIIGGTTTTVSQVPYIVYLKRNGNFICGGTLIRKDAVLTAAHCVNGYKPSDFVVVGGATYLSSGGVSRQVIGITVPTKWDSSTLNMDVALLRLKSSMSGTNIATIGLCSGTVPTGVDVQISGWGLTSEGGSVSNQLRIAEVTTISFSTCKKTYGSLTSSMICASEDGSKDSCNGDSGGPLVYKNQLCGIVSWGIGCASRGYPGVYTDVNKVKTFVSNSYKQYF